MHPAKLETRRGHDESLRAMSSKFGRKLGYPILQSALRVWHTYKPVVDVGAGDDSVLFLAGVGRSGTTWIQNVICRLTRARPVFEPFLPTRDHQFALQSSSRVRESQLARGFQLYIRPDEGKNSPYYAPISQIMAGRVTGSWCNKTTRPGIYRRRVIKEIRSSLYLAYIANTWPNVRIIWIVRNPLAVIDSQIRTGWNFSWDRNTVFEQSSLIQDWLAPFWESIKRDTGELPGLAHQWCIAHYVPLAQQINRLKNVKLVRYEDLVVDLSAWGHISDFVSNSRWSSSRLHKYLQMNSQTALPDRIQPKPSERYSHLSSKDKRDIWRIVDEYGLTHLYSEQQDRGLCRCA